MEGFWKVPSWNITVRAPTNATGSASSEAAAAGNLVGYIGAGVIVLLVMVGAAGNAVVLISVTRFRKLHQAADHILIASLAATDLAFNVIIMPFYVDTYINQAWRYSRALCMLETFSGTLMVMASAYHIALIAVIRYFHVVHPTTLYPRIASRRAVLLQIAAIWTVCALIILPGTLGWQAEVGYSSQTGRCNYIRAKSKGSLCLVFVLGFILPCLAMVTFYMLIVKKLERSSWRVSSYSEKRAGAGCGGRTVEVEMLLRHRPGSDGEPVTRTLRNEPDTREASGIACCNHVGPGHCVAAATVTENGVLTREMTPAGRHVCNGDMLWAENKYVIHDERGSPVLKGRRPRAAHTSPQSPDARSPEAQAAINLSESNKPLTAKADVTPEMAGGHSSGDDPGEMAEKTGRRDHVSDECAVITPGGQQEPPQPHHASEAGPAATAVVAAANRPMRMCLLHPHHHHHRHHVKSLRMILGIFVAFVLTYLPFSIINLVDAESALRREWYMISSLAFWAGACVNPIIYGLMNSQFREAYRHVLCCPERNAALAR